MNSLFATLDELFATLGSAQNKAPEFKNNLSMDPD